MKITNRFHYGWVIVIVSFLGMMSWAMGRTLYPYVLPTMEAELNLAHVSMGSISSAYFITYTITTFVWGIITDRIGARKCMLIGAVIIILGLSGMGFMSSLTSGWLSYSLCGVGTAGLVIPIVRLVSGWFSGVRRGMALGITMSGVGTATLLLGFVIPMILASYSWRWSWWVGATFVLVVAAIGWFVLIDNPTNRSLAPIQTNTEEFAASQKQHMKENPERIEPKVTLKDILKRGTVWNLAGVYGTYGMGEVTFMTFTVAYLQEIGWGVQVAAGVFATWAAVSISGPLISGTIADYLPKKYLLAMLAALMGAGMLIFLSGSTAAYYIGAAMVGFVAPSLPTVMAASMADYHDPRVIGTTFGFVTLFLGMGGIIGPTLGGALGDATGTLSTAILLSSGISFLSFVLALVLKKPAK
ncbi:nitrate/nitrite transporter [Chloroflexota bacterium]